MFLNLTSFYTLHSPVLASYSPTCFSMLFFFVVKNILIFHYGLLFNFLGFFSHVKAFTSTMCHRISLFIDIPFN